MNLFYKHQYKNQIKFFLVVINYNVNLEPNILFMFNIDVNSSVLFNENCSVQCNCELFCILTRKE